MSGTTSAAQRAKAERLAAQRAARVAGQRPDESSVDAPARAERVKPVRMSLDLAPPLFEELEDWTLKVARRQGSRVNKADVLRLLVRELLDDEELQATVIARLRSIAD